MNNVSTVSFLHSFWRVFVPDLKLHMLNVTVQFETEGNVQNEILSHMDKSEVKL